MNPRWSPERQTDPYAVNWISNTIGWWKNKERLNAVWWQRNIALQNKAARQNKQKGFSLITFSIACAMRKKLLTSSRNWVGTNSKTLFIAVSNFWTDGSSNRHNEEKKTQNMSMGVTVGGLVSDTCSVSEHMCMHISYSLNTVRTLGSLFFLLDICSQAGISKVLLCRRGGGASDVKCKNAGHIWALVFPSTAVQQQAGVRWKHRNKHLNHVYVSWSVKQYPFAAKTC